MKQFSKYFAMAGLLALMVACTKDQNVDQAASAEETIVKLPQAANALNIVAVDAVPGQIEVGVLEVRRDIKSEADLNKTQVVKIAPNPTMISDYNSANGANYQTFTGYTLNPETPFDGQNWTVTFKPGEFVKYIKVKFDPLNLDLSKQYALAFKISQADGARISGSKKNALVAIAVKNQWHGVYHASGIFHHPTGGDRPIDEDKSLVTSGAKSVKAPLGDLGGAGYAMILTINPDNTVTITPAGVTPNIDQHWGPNYYDPATKSFHLNYSYNVAAPRIVEETLTKL